MHRALTAINITKKESRHCAVPYREHNNMPRKHWDLILTWLVDGQSPGNMKNRGTCSTIPQGYNQKNLKREITAQTPPIVQQQQKEKDALNLQWLKMIHQLQRVSFV